MVCRAKNPKPAGGVRCVAHDVVGASRHGVCIHRVAECAGVRVALALRVMASNEYIIPHGGTVNFENREP